MRPASYPLGVIDVAGVDDGDPPPAALLDEALHLGQLPVGLGNPVEGVARFDEFLLEIDDDQGRALRLDLPARPALPVLPLGLPQDFIFGVPLFRWAHGQALPPCDFPPRTALDTQPWRRTRTLIPRRFG
jgi:hypothetical protein